MLCAARAIKNLLRLSVQTSCRENFLCAKRACQPRNTRQKDKTVRFGTKNRHRLQNLIPFSAELQVRLCRERPYLVLAPVGFYAQITYHGRRLRKPNLTLTRLRTERRGLLIRPTAHLAGGATGFLIRPITIFHFCPCQILSQSLCKTRRRLRKPILSPSQYIRAGQICHARSCGDGETETIRPSGYTSLRFVACS